MGIMVFFIRLKIIFFYYFSKVISVHIYGNRALCIFEHHSCILIKLKMGERSAAVMSHLIGIGLMIAAMMVFKRKAAGQPGMKIYGLSMKTIYTICYTCIAFFVVLIIAVLAGWEKS
jgi:hypothetical protein